MSGKYSLTYGRKIRVADYETANIELTVEYDRAETGPDDAWKSQHEWVLKRVAEETGAKNGGLRIDNAAKHEGPPPIAPPPAAQPAQPAASFDKQAEQARVAFEKELEAIPWRLNDDGSQWFFAFSRPPYEESPAMPQIRRCLEKSQSVRVGVWEYRYAPGGQNYVQRRKF